MSSNPLLRTLAALATALAFAAGCGGGGGFAASGGTSGTGISQGSITAFGSIFVNGVQWDVDGAEVLLDGAPGDETDLRVGMVVRVEGDFSADGLSGTALSVHFDDSLEGPIGDDPVVIDALGERKQFRVLDVPVIVDVADTVFADGATFAGLARDQVVEVSGFEDEAGAIRATRVELLGTFPGIVRVERRGTVDNLVRDMAGGGVFDLGSVTVYFDATTRFEDGSSSDLREDIVVEVEGDLRISGDEIDASEIEFEDEGLGAEDLEDVEIEGFVTSYVSDASFRVAGVPVDASGALFDPVGLVLADGVQVEVEGRLEGGVIVADEVEGEGDDDPDEDEARVRIDAAVGSILTGPSRLVLLDVEVEVDADTELEDERDDLPNFRFVDIAPGDWLEVEAVLDPGGGVRALRVERDDVGDDVRFEGPVTDVDPLTPGLDVLDQPIAVDGATLFFDAFGAPRSEEEFFRNPGDLQVGDTVRVTDEDAVDPEVLGVADRLEIEDD